jgi:hypothetical protein
MVVRRAGRWVEGRKAWTVVVVPAKARMMAVGVTFMVFVLFIVCAVVAVVIELGQNPRWGVGVEVRRDRRTTRLCMCVYVC